MSFIDNIKSRVTGFVTGIFDKLRDRFAGLEKKHYCIIGGVAAVVVALIVLWIIFSRFPAERFGDDYHYGEVAHLVFNEDGSLLASAELNQQAQVIVWDTSSRTLRQRVDGNTFDSRMIAFTQNDQVLVTVGDDRLARFWDISKGDERSPIQVPLSSKAALSLDGRWLAYHKGTHIVVWDLSFSKEDNTFEGDASSSNAMSFSPDSKLLAVGDRNGILRIYVPAEKEMKVSPAQAHNARITCVVFSPDSKVVGTASDDKTAKLWNADGEKLKELAHFKGHEQAVDTIAVGPDAKLVLTGSRDSTARLWHGKSGKQLFKFENFRGEGDSKLAICADGSLAAIELTDGGIEVLETASGHSELRINVPVSTFAFKPDGTTLYMGRLNGTLYTWKRGME